MCGSMFCLLLVFSFTAARCYLISRALRHLSLSVSTAIFPGEPELAGFIEAKGDVGGGDNWSYKSCKAPVKSSPPTNQRGVRHPCCEETRT